MQRKRYGVGRRGPEPEGGSSQAASQGGPSRARWRWGGLYPKMPPKVEAMTMPRTTQQMMIMIFFCTGRRGEASARKWGQEGG